MWGSFWVSRVIQALGFWIILGPCGFSSILIWGSFGSLGLFKHLGLVLILGYYALLKHLDVSLLSSL